MLSKWKTISSRVVDKNAFWEYKHNEFELPNGKKGNYWYVSRRGAVIIVPVRDDGKIVLLRNYRYLFDKEGFEFPAGMIDDAKTPEQQAVDELIQEASLTGTFKQIGAFAPDEAFDNAMGYAFVASNLTENKTQEKDESEEFEVIEVESSEIDQMIRDGRIWDGFSITAWMLYKLNTNT